MEDTFGSLAASRPPICVSSENSARPLANCDGTPGSVVALLDVLAVSAGRLRSAGVSSRVVDSLVVKSFDMVCGVVASPPETVASSHKSGVSLPPSQARAEVARVKKWRDGVSKAAERDVSWRSDSTSSASGFSTILSEPVKDLPVAPSSGRCYQSLATVGCKTKLSRMLGKWPTFSRILTAPAVWFSVAKLSEYGLVRSAELKWHVVPLNDRLDIASVRDTLARILQSHDDVLAVGDRRWDGTLLQVVSDLAFPAGTFDVPSLSDRLGGDEVSSPLGTSVSVSSGTSAAGLPEYPFKDKVDSGSVTELQAEILKSYYSACSSVRLVRSRRQVRATRRRSDRSLATSSGHFGRRASSVVGGRVSGVSSPMAIPRSSSDWRIPVSLSASSIAESISTQSADVAGYGYVSLLREHERLSYSAVLGSWPTISAMLCTPRHVWDEVAIWGYGVKPVETGRYRILPISSNSASVVAVFARVVNQMPSYPNPSLASVATTWVDNAAGYYLLSDRLG